MGLYRGPALATGYTFSRQLTTGNAFSHQLLLVSGDTFSHFFSRFFFGARLLHARWLHVFPRFATGYATSALA